MSRLAPATEAAISARAGALFGVVISPDVGATEGSWGRPLQVPRRRRDSFGRFEQGSACAKASRERRRRSPDPLGKDALVQTGGEREADVFVMAARPMGAVLELGVVIVSSSPAGSARGVPAARSRSARSAAVEATARAMAALQGVSAIARRPIELRRGGSPALSRVGWSSSSRHPSSDVDAETRSGRARVVSRT